MNAITLKQQGRTFEAYGNDADVLSGVCGVGQFSRENSIENVAAFSADNLPYYLPKLARAGYKIVVVEESK